MALSAINKTANVTRHLCCRAAGFAETMTQSVLLSDWSVPALEFSSNSGRTVPFAVCLIAPLFVDEGVVVDRLGMILGKQEPALLCALPPGITSLDPSMS